MLQKNEQPRAAEMDPIKQAKKEKRKARWEKFNDNWLILGLKTLLMEYIGIIGITVIFLILMDIIAMITGNSVILDDYSGLRFFSSDLMNTAIEYFAFIGIWIAGIVWMLIFKKNRPILQSFLNHTKEAEGKDSKKRKGNTLPMFCLGILIGGGMNGLCILFAWLHGDIQLKFSRFQFFPLLFLLVSVLIQSSAEEMCCRGYYFQRLLMRYKKPWLAILISSAFFAALHLGNDGIGIISLINLLVAGILFSMLVYFMDSFWCAAAAHMAWNFTQNIVFGLPNSGIRVPYSVFTLTAERDSLVFYDAEFGIEGSVMSIIVQLIMCLVIFLICRKRKTLN